MKLSLPSHCLRTDGDFVISIDGVVFSNRSRVIHYPLSHPNINNSRYAATSETLEAAGVRAAASCPARRPAPLVAPAALAHSTNSCFFSSCHLPLRLRVLARVKKGRCEQHQPPSPSSSSSVTVAVCSSVWTWRQRNCSECVCAWPCVAREWGRVDCRIQLRPRVKFNVCQPSFIKGLFLWFRAV